MLNVELVGKSQKIDFFIPHYETQLRMLLIKKQHWNGGKKGKSKKQYTYST